MVRLTDSLNMTIAVYCERRVIRTTAITEFVNCLFFVVVYLTLLHSEWPKLCGVLTILSAIGLRYF